MDIVAYYQQSRFGLALLVVFRQPGDGRTQDRCVVLPEIPERGCGEGAFERPGRL